MSIKERVTDLAKKVTEAAVVLSNTSGQQRNELLARMAELLRAHSSKIIRGNAIDMERGEEKGLSSAMLDRLLLNDERIEKMAAALEEIIELPDPLAQTLDEWTRPNGLLIQKRRVRSNQLQYQTGWGPPERLPRCGPAGKLHRDY